MSLLPKLRAVLAAGLLLAVALPAMADELPVLRLGVQKYGTLIIVKQRATLEQALASQNVKVEWTEFPGGPQMLEALNAGSIDFGITGEAPPVFAQAAGAPLLYVGVEPPAPDGEAILVHKDSGLKTVADLKGKKVALNKGSNVHYLLVQALAANGLTPADINIVYLPPADARAAFEGGSVDAWVIWDPYLASAQSLPTARTLIDATGLAPNVQFFLSSKRLATEHPNVLRAVLSEIEKSDAWGAQHPAEVVELMTKSTGLPKEVVEVAVKRLPYGIKPLDDQTIANQQKIADTFFKLNLIPKPLIIRDAVFRLPAS
jgi:sulfonate transport system substrate-binding protein